MSSPSSARGVTGGSGDPGTLGPPGESGRPSETDPAANQTSTSNNPAAPDLFSKPSTSLGSIRPLPRRAPESEPAAADEPDTATTSAATDAAARRKERKAARAAIPAPERDPAYDHLSLDDVRSLRTALSEEETRVSYWRRIVQARLDVVRMRSHHTSVADLSKVLADASGAHHRIAHLSLDAVEGVPPLPDLAELWTRFADPSDDDACARLEADLEAAEHNLSALRGTLHRNIDAATRELIARYRENPVLALAVLPRDPLSY